MCDKLIEKCIKEETRRALYNVIVMSIGFVFVQAPMVTMVNAQDYFIDSLKVPFKDFTGIAYVASFIFMAVFGISNWIAPSVAKTIGPRNSLAFGALFFALYYVQFTRPINWLFYTTPVILGIGAAVLWAGQALYLARNSYEDTISRNVGIFWGLFPICMLVGNIYLLCTSDINYEEDAIRIRLIAALTFISSCGLMIMYIASKAVLPPHEKTSPWQILKGAFKLSWHKKMLLLSLTAAHTGNSFSLTTGIYSNALAKNGGFTEHPYKILGTSGVLIAICNITISSTLGIIGHKIEKWGRYKVLILGTLAHSTVPILASLNSPNGVTQLGIDSAIVEDTILKNNIYIGFACSCLLGFGDGVYNTQLFSQLISSFSDKATEAYSLARFIQCLFGAIFYLIALSGFYAAMAVFCVSAIIGYVGFYFVSSRKEENEANTQTGETQP